MAAKILVNYPGSLHAESLASKRQQVADQLGVCPEDVIFVSGMTVAVVDLPDELTKARAKADAKAAKEKAKLEAEAAGVEAAPAAADYESMTSEELHAEATRRDIRGRSGLDKAGLVEALKKADKGE